MSEGKLKNCHCEEERSPDVSISAILFILLIPFSAHATCTPTPDCASIGYTETSCEGDSLKCPFDTSKLYCVSCDSSFKYECVGDNIVSAVGETCGNKYVICECVAGATFINGTCICDTSCSVGNIYYSDGTCNSCLDNTKTAVGVVVKDNELITQIDYYSVFWASIADSNVSGLDDMKKDVAIADMNGFDNTKKIIEFYTSDNETNNAGWYCYNLEIEGLENRTNEWYLPAVGELYNYYYKNYNLIIKGFSVLGKSYTNLNVWSSSEIGFYRAWKFNVATGKLNGNTVYDLKTNKLPIACFLKIK